METQLPVTPFSFGLAALPIVVLLVLLVGREWSISSAAPVAYGVAASIAVTFFRTPLETIAVAAGKGIWDALFVLYVVWPALILYEVAERAEAFEAIERGVRRLIPDRLLVILTFAWVLTAFIQSVAGFGTPLAVVCPILLGLRVKPFYAVLLPLIGGAWANSFGSLGAPWLALRSVVDVPNEPLTLVMAAGLCAIPQVLGGIAIAWLYGRSWALRRAAPAIAIVGLLQAVILIALITLVLPVASFLATAAGLGAVIVLGRWSFYRQEDEHEPDLIFTAPGGARARRSTAERPQDEAPVRRDEPAEMPLPLAFAPYALLGAMATLALVVPPIRTALESIQVGLPFPAADTGFGVRQEAVDAYGAFTPLTHPGTFLLLSALAGYALYSSAGRYPRETSAVEILRGAAEGALPVTTGVAGLLLMSKVMEHSGEINVLALGVAAAAPDLVYLAAANFIGILGSLVTSSNTASNILFAPLQATAAQSQGLPVSVVLAAQVAGGGTGNAIAPSDVLLGATTVRNPSLVGSVLRRAIPWAVLTGLLISIATVVLSLTVSGSVGRTGP